MHIVHAQAAKTEKHVYPDVMIAAHVPKLLLRGVKGHTNNVACRRETWRRLDEASVNPAYSIVSHEMLRGYGEKGACRNI